MKTVRDQMWKDNQSLNQMENEHQDQDQITQEAKAVHHQGLLRHKLQDIGLDILELEYLSFKRNYNAPKVFIPWRSWSLGRCKGYGDGGLL